MKGSYPFISLEAKCNVLLQSSRSARIYLKDTRAGLIVSATGYMDKSTYWLRAKADQLVRVHLDPEDKTRQDKSHDLKTWTSLQLFSSWTLK